MIAGAHSSNKKPKRGSENPRTRGAPEIKWQQHSYHHVAWRAKGTASTSDEWPPSPPPGPLCSPSPGLRFDQLTRITCLPPGCTRSRKVDPPSILERQQAPHPPDNTTQRDQSLSGSDSGCQTHRIRQTGPTQCMGKSRDKASGCWPCLPFWSQSLEVFSFHFIEARERLRKPGLVPKMVMCSVIKPANQSKPNTDWTICTFIMILATTTKMNWSLDRVLQKQELVILKMDKNKIKKKAHFPCFSCINSVLG